jgi:hypothetical protein
MTRFLDYYALRETGEAEQVKSGFEQLRTQIGGMFNSLYKAAQNTWGKSAPSLGDKTKQEVINGLESILAKIKGGSDVKSECRGVGQEIESLLNEAGGIADGLKNLGNSPAGRATYGMMDVLKNIESKIMQRVHGLEQSVLGQKIDALKTDIGDKISGSRADLGQDIRGVGNDVRGVHDKVDKVGRSIDAGVDDIRGDVAGYGQRADGRGMEADVRNRKLFKRLGGIDKKLDTPPQPLTHAGRNDAHQAIDVLYGLKNYAKEHDLKLVHPYTGDEIPFAALGKAKGRSALFSMAGQDANFVLKHAGNTEGTRFNIGDLSNVDHVVQSMMGDRKIDPNAYMGQGQFKTKPWGTHRDQTATPLAGEKRTTIAQQKQARAEYDAKELERRNSAAQNQFSSQQESFRTWFNKNDG